MYRKAILQILSVCTTKKQLGRKSIRTRNLAGDSKVSQHILENFVAAQSFLPLQCEPVLGDSQAVNKGKGRRMSVGCSEKDWMQISLAGK